MKHLLSLISLFLACESIQAQDAGYRPFTQEAKRWETQVGGIKENNYCYSIDGDTIINGEYWKKVYNYIAFPNLNKAYFAAIRDMENKVYVIGKGRNRPRLLYDFGLKVGDVVQCGIEGNAFLCLLDKDEPSDTLFGFPFATYLKVESVDTIEARGLQHRCYKLTLLDAYQQPFGDEENPILESVIWVEGVGSGSGPFSPWMPLPEPNMQYLSCLVEQTCIFGPSDFYDAGITVSINNTRNNLKESSQPFDLSGHRLSSPPTRKGVYVKDGRKVLIK